MSWGTDLSSAYGYDLDPTPKVASPPPAPANKPLPKYEEPARQDAIPPVQNFGNIGGTGGNNKMDPMFLTADQKLHLLSQELFKQKEHFENSKNNNYVDKLLSRKKDLAKLVTIALVVLFAISLHYLLDFYMKRYFEDNAMSMGKEFALRALYPAAVLFVLWNIKAFNK